MEQLRIIRGETAPVSMTLLRAMGQPHNLTDSTVAMTLVRHREWNGEIVDPPRSSVDGGVVTVTNAAGGVAEWRPSAELTATPGYYWLQVTITRSTGEVTKGPKDYSRYLVVVAPEFG